MHIQLFNTLTSGHKFSGGKLVDPTPQIEMERLGELDRVAKQYDLKGDVAQFPKFQFSGTK